MNQSSEHYFLAIPLPDEIRRVLARQATALKSSLPYKQWTNPNDYHITLAFLGAAGFRQMNELKHAVQRKTSGYPSFSIQLSGLGTFGKRESPRVLWAGISSDTELFSLQNQIRNAAEMSGFQLDQRPYRPHITLAKKWAGTDSLERDQLKVQLGEGSWEVKEIVLFRTLMGQIPKYQPLKIFRF